VYLADLEDVLGLLHQINPDELTPSQYAAIRRLEEDADRAR